MEGDTWRIGEVCHDSFQQSGPDAHSGNYGGYRYWIDWQSAGLGVVDVADLFAASAEHNKRHGHLATSLTFSTWMFLVDRKMRPDSGIGSNGSRTPPMSSPAAASLRSSPRASSFAR